MAEQMALVIEGKPIAPETNCELLKHSAATQISNRISLIQRKSYNALLYFARQQATKNPDLEMYTVSVNDMRRFGGLLIKDVPLIKASLKELMSIIVDYNILGKDKFEEWGAFALLSEVKESGKGTISFAFPPSIKNALLNPRMYARINIAITRGLTSKYSLALYEIAKDYISVTIPRMSIESFRNLMGIEPSYYESFPDLRRRVIEPAIKEINNKTDLNISVEYIKNGRKIVGLQFTTREQNWSCDGVLVEDAMTQVEDIIANIPDLHNNEKFKTYVAKMIKDRGIGYVISNIQYSLSRAKQNIEAYTISALEEDYASGERTKTANLTKANEIKSDNISKELENDQKILEETTERYIEVFNQLSQEEKDSIIEQISSVFYAGRQDVRIMTYLKIEKGIEL